VAVVQDEVDKIKTEDHVVCYTMFNILEWIVRISLVDLTDRMDEHIVEEKKHVE